MATKKQNQHVNADLQSVKHYAKIYQYPCGLQDIIASSKPDFGPPGWEAAENWARVPRALPEVQHEEQNERRPKDEAHAEDLARSMRRARAKVRRIALANDFKWFVTLTLDPAKVDSHDGAAVVRKLNAWCSNMVQRHGLRYILVPERHKKGGIHFHGFFSDSLEATDSGTMRPPEGGKPKRPRSEAQRAEWLSNGGQVVYNLPGWTLGFTTAMELYGEYPAAVSYVCKYIGKEGEKPAGRWYYSGGDLQGPAIMYAELSPRDLVENYGEKVWTTEVPGRTIAVINGLKYLDEYSR